MTHGSCQRNRVPDAGHRGTWSNPRLNPPTDLDLGVIEVSSPDTTCLGLIGLPSKRPGVDCFGCFGAAVHPGSPRQVASGKESVDDASTSKREKPDSAPPTSTVACGRIELRARPRAESGRSLGGPSSGTTEQKTPCGTGSEKINTYTPIEWNVPLIILDHMLLLLLLFLLFYISIDWWSFYAPMFVFYGGAIDGNRENTETDRIPGPSNEANGSRAIRHVVG